MQSEEQSVNDSNSATDSKTQVAWPPNLLRLVLGALLTAGLGFAVLKTLYPVFVVPEELVNFPEQSPRWMYERLDKAKSQVDGKNFMLVFGIVGAIFGASSVAFAFGARAVKSMILAVVGAAALGVLGAFLSNWMFNNLRETSGKELVIMGIGIDAMKQTIIGYGLLWGLIGLGVGVGIGSARGISKLAVAGISGLCGGVLGAMLYVILTAQLSAGTMMNQVIPYTNASQAIWLAIFPLAIATCIALGTGEKKTKQIA